MYDLFVVTLGDAAARAAGEAANCSQMPGLQLYDKAPGAW